jgi:hypothetical protein
MRPPKWFGTVIFQNGKDHLKPDNPKRFMEYLASKRGKRVQFVLADYDPVDKSDRNYYFAEIVPAFALEMGYPKEEHYLVHDIIKKMMHIETTKGFKASDWKEYVAGCKRQAAQQGIPIRDKRHVDLEEEAR